MTAQEIVNGLKKVFFTNETPEVKEVKFIDAKSTDGLILRSDAETFTIGNQLIIVNEDGTMTPAADSDYTLEDGTVVKAQGGVITDVIAKPIEQTQQEVKQTEEKQPETNAEIEILQGKITNLENTLTQLTEKIERFSFAQAQINEAVKLLSEQPAVTPIKKTEPIINTKLSKEKRPSEYLNEIIAGRK